jgi:hypothetical protein
VFVLPRRGLSQHDFEWLNRRCRLSVEWLPWRREHQLWLYYPISPEVLGFMVELTRRNPEVRHRQTQVALDLCFNSEEELERSRRIFDTYNVTPWCRVVPHRHRGTIYSKAKRSSNNRATYSDKPSRVTGEAHCLHIEARLKGSRALERHGVWVESIMSLDHHAFWKKHLRMSKVEDVQQIGRMVDNQAKEKSRRKPSIYRSVLSSGREFVYDRDSAVCRLFVRSGRATQGIIIKLRERGIDIQHRGCLKPIEVSQLLPRENGEGRSEMRDCNMYLKERGSS